MKKGFHATEANIKEFNLDFLYGGEHNFGPGIYFSDESDTLGFYNEGALEPKIYEVDLDDRNIVIWHELIDNSIIEKLINISQYKDLFVKEKGLNFYIQKYSNKNYLYFLQNFPFEIWDIENRPSNNELELNCALKKVLKNLNDIGIDGLWMQNGTYRNEYVIFNKEIIKIIEIHYL